MLLNKEFRQGQRAFLRGEYQQSILSFGKALESGMEPAKVYEPFGLAYLRNSQFAEAITAFSHALEIDATHARLWFFRGMARFNQGDLSDALHDFDHSLRLQPGDSMTLVARSLVHTALRQEPEAEADMQAAVRGPGVEAELFIRDYCIAPLLRNLAQSLFDVYQAPWGEALKAAANF